jgi:hypothetical protein
MKKFILAMIMLLSLIIGAQSASVMTAWTPSISTNVVTYNIYYGGTSGVYTNMVSVLGGQTNATVSGLTPGVTYYFAATAQDSLGYQSIYSNEAVYTVPVTPTNVTSYHLQINREIFIVSI